MAVIKKAYTSENQYLEDLAKSTEYFDYDYYEIAKEEGQGLNYLSGILTGSENISSSFDKEAYNRLTGADKFNYFVTENLLDKGSKDYKTNSEYYTQKIQQLKNQEIYDSLSGFEKTINSVGGFFANTMLQVGGIIEGLVDVSLAAYGAVGGIFDANVAEKAKALIAEDTTGYNAAQKAMNEWTARYTFNDKNAVSRAINDVASAIGRMAPMILGHIFDPVTGGVSGALGTTAYYLAMAGNTAEEAVVANPDINYGSLLLYTGAVVGVEALTEKTSDILFGPGLIGLKGLNSKALTGYMFKDIGKNFMTEALEEATSEIFDSLLYRAFVDPTKDTATMSDIFYAAIIGGLTGAVMTGGRAVLGTKKMSINEKGELVYTSSLTKDEKKTSKQLGLAKSYGLTNLISQTQQNADNVTKLMAKYGTSLDDIIKNHSKEYENAKTKDVDIRDKQSKAILDLSNLLNAIGVEQFSRSAKFLNENIEEARILVDNFINHTDRYNKLASETFSAAFPGETFTPTELTSDEKVLSKAMSEISPKTSFVFGEYGSEDGSAIRAINIADKGKIVFIEKGLIEKQGYTETLRQIVALETANDLKTTLDTMNTEYLDSLVKVITDTDTKYSDLSEEQKLSIAQMLCYDAITNKKLFSNNKEVHSAAFKYISKQANFLKNFARKTEANKIKYNNILKIRNTFLKSISDTIYNTQDVETIQKLYNLTDEETKTKITDKTVPTILNINTNITNINFSNKSTLTREAINALSEARKTEDKTIPFDFSQMYNEEYYKPEFVNNIKSQQKTENFEKALNSYLEVTYKTRIDISLKDTINKVIKESVSEKNLMNIANVILTKEFIDSAQDLTAIQNEVSDTIYTMVQNAEDIDANSDSIVIENGTIKGTGKLKFLKVKGNERINVTDYKSQRGLGESSDEQIGGLATKSTTIADQIEIKQINNTAYNNRQKEMTSYAKQEYGVNLYFYEGSAILKGYDKTTDYGLNGFIYENNIYVRYDDTLSESAIEKILLHEGTHKLISTNKQAYYKLRDKIKSLAFDFDAWIKEYSSDDMYGKIYDNTDDIVEEIIVDICCGRVNGIWTTHTFEALEAIFDFYNSVSHIMYNIEQSFFDKNKTLSQQNIRDRMRQHIMTSQTATWSKDRLDFLINRNTSTSDPNRVEAYAAYINPHDFVAATTSSARERSTIRQQMRDYDYLGNLSNITETPYLRINPDTMEIVGHEGRHRMWAMSENGITEAAVVIYLDTQDISTSFFKNNTDVANRIYEFVTFKGQTDYSGSSAKENRAFVTFRNMIPLNESHRTDLEKTFVKGFSTDEGPKIKFAKDITTPNQQKKTNITEKDITQLSSKNYLTGEKRTSTQKGFEGKEYEKASVFDYDEKNSDILSKIETLDDLKAILKAIDDGKITELEKSFLLDLIQAKVIPFNFYGSETAKKLLEPYIAPEATRAAQEQAARSQLFSETNPVESLSLELGEKTGTPVQIPDSVVIKWVPYYANRKEYIKQIKNEYTEIENKRKTEKDPYLKQQYTLQLNNLRNLARWVSDGNNAAVLDYEIKKLQDSDTDRVKNAEKVSLITKDVVEQLVKHTNTNGKPQYTPNKKYILTPEQTAKAVSFWENINSFRYLAMLSSPATWGRNGLTNTAISINAIVEDAASKKIENTKYLRAQSQANYTGDYDNAFSQFIDKLYGPKVDSDTKGDKYHEKEIDMIRQEYAQETDPLKKQEFLYKIKIFQQKMLNDQPWTKRRVLRNLKNTLAGSMNLIGNSVYSEIKALYRGETTAEILENMKNKNSPLADLFEQVYVKNNGNDMIGTIELASKLSSSSQLLQQIYDNAMYRGNKLLFKTDNALTKAINKIKKSHPMTAAFISMIVPFARTSYNTTAYIMNHSPIGLAKGIIQSLQTRQMYIADMKQEIDNYYKEQYVKEQKASNEDFKFDNKKYSDWMLKNAPQEAINALKGDVKSIKSLFNTLAKKGLISESLIGSNDIFARATAIESISQGLNGTAWLTLGLILASMLKGFKIDEDDYLGPVLVINDWRIKLSDLSPFSTMFSVGAIINSSDNVLNGFENFAKILVDQSMLNVVESAMQYSDGIIDYLGNQNINLVQQFIPAIVKNLTKVIDQNKKDKSGNYWNKLVNTTLSNLPLFSFLVANKIDPYTGETKKMYQSGTLEAILNQLFPVGIRSQTMSDLEREAKSLNVETTGLSGNFSVNDKSYTVKDKEKYSKYRADYIESQFNAIISGKQRVTVEDDNGKRITTTYDKLTDKQKKNVISRLYTEATSITKIQWWLDLGNKYVVTDKDLYNEYRKMFDSNNIIYKTTWSKSKFMES